MGRNRSTVTVIALPKGETYLRFFNPDTGELVFTIGADITRDLHLGLGQRLHQETLESGPIHLSEVDEVASPPASASPYNASVK